MSSAIEIYRDVHFDERLIERIILDLAETFDIRVMWDHQASILTGACALAGGLVGGFAGGRFGAAMGAGIGGVTGYGVSTMVSLKDIWDSVKDQLKELAFIVINFLRRFDRMDYERAYYILMACTTSRRNLVFSIIEFIGDRLKRQMCSSIQPS